MVNEMKNPSSLRIKLDLGMVDGKTKVKSKTFSSLKHNALAQNVYDVGEALINIYFYKKVIFIVKYIIVIIFNYYSYSLFIHKLPYKC